MAGDDKVFLRKVGVLHEPDGAEGNQVEAWPRQLSRESRHNTAVKADNFKFRALEHVKAFVFCCKDQAPTFS